LALLSILPILLVFLLIGTNRVEASDGSADQVTSKVVVQPGQSLWDLALSVDPKEDPRKTIWLIQQLNAMTSSEVLAGQELIVPIAD
jgi:nucleoid-associated protein YgaU